MTDASAAYEAVGAAAGPVARSSVVRVGLATAITAACGYAVLYLAARNLEPAGFSVFAVFWGAFGLVTGAPVTSPKAPQNTANTEKPAGSRLRAAR